LLSFEPCVCPAVAQVLVSLAACAVAAFVGLPILGYYTGLAGVAKYWLMPWLGYHFWMSTFTVVHHTAPHIPFKPAEQWNAAKAQLSGAAQGHAQQADRQGRVLMLLQ
jgi:omega-6 fatty acid desaturase (delta-12 desaturase)